MNAVTESIAGQPKVLEHELRGLDLLMERDRLARRRKSVIRLADGTWATFVGCNLFFSCGHGRQHLHGHRIEGKSDAGETIWGKVIRLDSVNDIAVVRAYPMILPFVWQCGALPLPICVPPSGAFTVLFLNLDGEWVSGQAAHVMDGLLEVNTSAEMGGGCSGGPLLTREAELVGVIARGEKVGPERWQMLGPAIAPWIRECEPELSELIKES
jgi:hypothetical protein